MLLALQLSLRTLAIHCTVHQMQPNRCPVTDFLRSTAELYRHTAIDVVIQGVRYMMLSKTAVSSEPVQACSSLQARSRHHNWTTLHNKLYIYVLIQQVTFIQDCFVNSGYCT